MADEKTIIKIKNGRASYPRVYEPRKAAEGKDPRFELTVLLDPSNAEHAKQILAIKQECARVAKEFHGEDVDVKKLKMPFSVNEDDADYCPGWFALQMWNKERPLVVNRANVPTVSEKDNEHIFAGCTINTNPTFFGWKYQEPGTKMVKKGVSANLRTAQYVSGTAEDRFGGGSRSINVEDEFEAIGEAAAVAGVSGVDPFA